LAKRALRAGYGEAAKIETGAIVFSSNIDETSALALMLDP
jgi:hypothetical protein